MDQYRDRPRTHDEAFPPGTRPVTRISAARSPSEGASTAGAVDVLARRLGLVAFALAVTACLMAIGTTGVVFFFL